MSKAKYIHKRVVDDYITLQNWLMSRKLESRDEWDLRCHEMDSHEMAEHHGYARAIESTIEFMGSLMKSWPDLNTHRDSSSTMT